MTPRAALGSFLKRLSQWSTPPKVTSRTRNAYRSEYQRFLWGAIFLVGYCFAVFFTLSRDGGGSVDNDGLWITIVLGVFLIVVGAYFAPGWGAIASKYTASGRRAAVEKAERIKHPTHRSGRMSERRSRMQMGEREYQRQLERKDAKAETETAAATATETATATATEKANHAPAQRSGKE